MTDFPSTFASGQWLTADYFNQMIADQLQRLQANNFDAVDQTGNPTLYTYDVPEDKDQIIIINVYLDNSHVETDGSFASVIWTDMEGTVQEPFTIANNPNVGGIVMFARCLKAKRGTQIIITGTGGAGDIFSCGGSIVVVKSVS